ncbi:hypothetical protein [Vibrio parahaemolyticus]|uniref:hypothetical protein n=1 Tax=Vibrio parahaemolyticus TaxID=670 RepID=UPI0027E5ACA4|nr:hypothetical protein [Vibrio parahaemolyticus]
MSQLHNKLFKSDSQRVAFLLCVGFSVLGGMRELRYCVAHTLTGRYVLREQNQMLRQLGDFPNISFVEYATINVRVKNEFLPKNLRSYHWEHDENSMITLSVSPSGRLRGKSIYLESLELAEEFSGFLHQLFSQRKYKADYSLEVVVETSSRGKTISRWKAEDSQKVRDALQLQVRT